MPDLRTGEEGIRVPTFRFVCSACRTDIVGGQSEMINELVPQLEKDDPNFKYWDVVPLPMCCSKCARRIKANNEEAQFEIADIERAQAQGLPRPKPKPIKKDLELSKAAEQEAVNAKNEDLQTQILAALGTINTNMQNIDARLQAVEQTPLQKDEPKTPKAKPTAAKKTAKPAPEPLKKATKNAGTRRGR